jgi:hypothetical protein
LKVLANPEILNGLLMETRLLYEFATRSLSLAALAFFSPSILPCNQIGDDHKNA